MIPVYQTFKVVRNIHQVFHFDRVVDRQTMEEMEMTQEETQEEMMVRNPKTLIKTFMVSNLANHPMIQTRVGMMEEEDGRHQAPLTINRWAKPLPKLDLPPRVHLQKAPCQPIPQKNLGRQITPPFFRVKFHHNFSPHFFLHTKQVCTKKVGW